MSKVNLTVVFSIAVVVFIVLAVTADSIQKEVILLRMALLLCIIKTILVKWSK